MKVLIIGGVAAGTKVGAKLKRENRDIEVTLITDSPNVSHVSCGLPYYVGGVMATKEELVKNTPEKFSGLTGVELFVNTRAESVDVKNKVVKAVDVNTNEAKEFQFDKLVIATGASPINPPIEGKDLEGVFFMRTPEDAIALKDYIDKNNPKRATVVGGGFIGLEIAENFSHLKMPTMVIDMADSVPPGFDKEFADYIKRSLAESGVMLFTGTKLVSLEGKDGKVSAVVTDKNKLPSDVVVLSIGVRPNTKFLDGTGLELAKNGAVIVNEYMETNIEDIYAVGDCAMVYNRITGKPLWSPMGSTANLAGRILAINMAGKRKEKLKYNGAIGTFVAKLPNLNIGGTGLTNAKAKEAGFDPVSATISNYDKADFYPDASFFIIKITADKKTEKLLGVQVLGLKDAAVDKIVDTGAVAISMGAVLEELKDLDLAYAPPFSMAISPFVHAVNVLKNKIDGDLNSISLKEYDDGVAEGYTILDASLSKELTTKKHIEVPKINGEIEGLDKDGKYLIVCTRGQMAYLSQNRMKHYGYKNTLTLEGGTMLASVDKMNK